MTFSDRRQRAFTLIELLVACVVFGIITIVLGQVFGSVVKISNSSQRHLDIMNQVVGAVQRLEFDLKSALRTGGMAPFVIKDQDASGNDALVFFAPVSSSLTPSDPRTLSIVRYSVLERSDKAPSSDWPSIPSLSRTIHQFAWDDDLGKLQPLSTAKVDDVMNGEIPQQVAQGIIRFEICFERWDGSTTASQPDDWTEVRALVVGFVVIDKKAATLLTSEQRAELASLFRSLNDHERPVDIWNAVSVKSLPRPLQETLKVYEQTIPI